MKGLTAVRRSVVHTALDVQDFFFFGIVTQQMSSGTRSDMTCFTNNNK